jgi:hypothetical protein
MGQTFPSLPRIDKADDVVWSKVQLQKAFFTSYKDWMQLKEVPARILQFLWAEESMKVLHDKMFEFRQADNTRPFERFIVYDEELQTYKPEVALQFWQQRNADFWVAIEAVLTSKTGVRQEVAIDTWSMSLAREIQKKLPRHDIYSEETIKLLSGPKGLGQSYLMTLGIDQLSEAKGTPYLRLDALVQERIIGTFLHNLRKIRDADKSMGMIPRFVDAVFGDDKSKYPKLFATFEHILKTKVFEFITQKLEIKRSGRDHIEEYNRRNRKRYRPDERNRAHGSRGRENSRYSERSRDTYRRDAPGSTKSEDHYTERNRSRSREKEPESS